MDRPLTSRSLIDGEARALRAAVRRLPGLVVIATTILASTAHAADFDPSSSAVREAYEGVATPEKIDAALAGLTRLTGSIQALSPPGFGWYASAGVSVTGPVNSVLPPHAVWLSNPGFVGPSLLEAASDADLGAPGLPVTLDYATLRALATFTTPRDFDVGPRSGTIDTNGFDLTITGRITTTAQLTKSGAGTLILTGANPWGVAPHVSAGMLRGDTVSLATSISNSATVEFNQAVDGAYARVVSGTGGVRKTGAGTLALTGANTYTGATEIVSGTLALQGAGQLSADTRVTVAAGAAFDIGAADGSRWVGALAGDGAVRLGARQLFTRSASDSNFGGVISGTGGLTKDGPGTLTLTGSNTYEGNTVVLDGTLALAAAGRIAPGSGLALYGGTFDITASGGSREIGSLSGSRGTVRLGAYTLVVGGDSTSTTYSGTMTGPGGVTKVGSGVLTLDGISTSTGTTTISQGTVLARTFSLGPRVVNDGTLRLFHNRSVSTPSIDAYSGNISGTGRLVKEGDDIVWLRGVNTYTGGTIVTSGVLIGNTDSLPGNVTNNAGLAFYQVADGTFAGAIDGRGTLFVYGPGVLTLTGNNSYSGGTALGGTMRVSSDANLGAPSSGVLMEGGTLLAGADVISTRPVTLGNAGGRFDTGGFDVVVAGVVGGPGSLTKTGAGTLTLGATNTYRGATLVNAGRLAIDGSIVSHVTVAAGAELSGAGTIFGNLVNHGRISRGGAIGTVNVAGNVTFAPGSTFAVRADPAGTSDRLVLGGTAARATLEGGTVDVQPSRGTYQPATRYTILTAPGGVTGAFAAVRSSSAFLEPTLAYDANNVFLTLARNETPFDSVALSANQRSVGRLLARLENGAGEDMALVLDALTTLSAADARAAFDAIAGAGRAGVSHVIGLTQRTVNQTVVGRLDAVDSHGGFAPSAAFVPGGARLASEALPGGPAGPLYAAAASDVATDATAFEPGRKHGLWLRGFGGHGTGDDGASAGFSYEVAGVIAGYDLALGDRVTLGALGSFSEPRVDQEGPSGHTDTKSYQFGLYGRYHAGAAHVDGILGYALTRTDTARSVAVGPLDRAARASYDGSTVSAQVEAGYTFRRWLEVTPLAGLHWTRQDQDGYTEHGAGVLSLVVPSRTVDSVRSTLGARALYPFELAATPMALEGRAGWAHEWSREGALSARLAGDPTGASFAVTGIRIPRDSAVLSMGFAAEPGRRLRVHADLTAEVNGVQQTYAVGAGLRYQW
jgi:autotransporter-associated beta strand protein